MGHVFLSDAWFDEANKIADEINPPVPDAVKDLVINVKVKGGPGGDVEAHMAKGRMNKGLADGAPTTLNVPYDVAKKMLIENDQQASMQAFMSGQIQVEGDMSKIMQMQAGGPPGPEAIELNKRIQAITE